MEAQGRALCRPEHLAMLAAKMVVVVCNIHVLFTLIIYLLGIQSPLWLRSALKQHAQAASKGSYRKSP
jgi:hypothetical protein